MAKEFWIDVRTLEEHNAGHLEGSAHIPFEEIVQRIGEVTDDKDAAIFVYCRSGNRSGTAQASLQAAGFTNVVNAGGYDALRAQQ